MIRDASKSLRPENGDSPLAERDPRPLDVAIVGLACAFPKARTAADFWNNIVRGVDAIDDVPPNRWETDWFFEPGSKDVHKICSKRGGYLGSSFYFNPLETGTMPRAIEGAEPDQFLVLRTVHEALADSGYLDRPLDGRRGAFILGRGNYLGAGLTALLQRGLLTEQTLEILRKVRPDLGEGEIDTVRQALRSGLPGFGADTAPGLIPNITTGRVANRLDFLGPTFTVDAACASSLIAIDLASRGLASGEFDIALTGGVHIFTDVPFLQVFCSMGALSPTSTIRPFDKRCDGTMPGEGVGILVLRRLADAERDGDRIYAVIKGAGTSSDGKALSVTAPRADGEELAIRRAYETSGVDPKTIGLIEAHGTGTPVGDPTEVESLSRVFGGGESAEHPRPLGSVKSMIGHTMPAAGAAAIIKTALALHHKLLPPSLHCEEPQESLAADDAPLFVSGETRPWIHDGSEHPRRAAVNAFGFGGVNAHVVLEEYVPPRISAEAETDRSESLTRSLECEIVVIGAESREGLVRELGALVDYLGRVERIELLDVAAASWARYRDADCRIVFVASSPEDLSRRASRAAEKLTSGEARPIRDSKGTYYLSESAHRGGRLAMIFPGQGSQYVGMLSELAAHFADVRNCFDAADASLPKLAGRRLSEDVFPPPARSDQRRAEQEARLSTIERANPAVLTAGGAMFLLLQRLGLRADMMTGHSSGEWLVLPASGMVEIDDFVGSMRLLDAVWRDMKSRDDVPRAVMLAVGTDRKSVERLADEIGKPIHIANDNCPHQVVVVVDPGHADEVLSALRERGIFTERMPFEHAYHTSLFTHATRPLQGFFESMRIGSPGATVYSAATTKPYPASRESVIDSLSRTFERPLRFQETIRRMHADGARIFLEVGPRANLTAFVSDILRGEEHIAIATDQHRKSSLVAAMHAIAQLVALHVDVDLSPLFAQRPCRPLTFDAQADTPPLEKDVPGMVEIQLGAPRLRLPEGVVAPPAATEPPSPQTAHSTSTASSPKRSTHPGDDLAMHASDAPSAPAEEPLRKNSFVNERRVQQTPPQPRVNADPLPESASADRAMHEHMRLMEQFLQAQQDVMSAYLSEASTSEFAVASAPNERAAMDDARAMALPRSDETTSGHTPKPARYDLIEQNASPESTPSAHESGAATERETEIAANASPVAADAGAADVATVLLEIVSEKTGYPVEMLDVEADMEADLGIDSIKRIEILGALQEAGGSAAASSAVDMEEVAKLKTLAEIIALFGEVKSEATSPARSGAGNGAPSGETAAARPAEPAVAAPRERIAAAPASSAPVDSSRRFRADSAESLTFAARTVRHLPGDEIVVHRDVTLEEDLYLRDHCFDSFACEIDPNRERLCIVPLTVSVEMMAEVASLLAPGQRVTKIRRVAAGKWIEVEAGGAPVTLQIEATRNAEGAARVTIKHYDAEHGDSAQPGRPLAECIVEFADSFERAPQPVVLNPKDARTPLCSAERMYEERRMFHGPSFQGVCAIDSVGTNGLVGALEVLPAQDLLAGNPDPRFIVDPFLFDAAGQLVGYWPVEYCKEGYVLFPVRIEEIELFRENLAPGERAKINLRVRDVQQRKLTADMDILAPDGSLWMRVTGWTDWRFYWDDVFYDFWRFPRDHFVSERIDVGDAGVECRMLAPFGEMGTSIWENLWAHLILSSGELHEYRAMHAPEARSSWIFGRAAAKDAVRAWLLEHHGVSLFPAEVEIRNRESGQPEAHGDWAQRIPSRPQLSISHKGNVAVAAVSSDPVGVDLEPIAPRDDSFAAVAFSDEERSVLAALPESDKDEWITRAWCAKEAGGKALGVGLERGPGTVRVTSFDASAGSATVADGDGAASPVPVRLLKRNDYIIALARASGSAYASSGS